MQRWLPFAILMLAAVRAPAVTKTVEVGPSGRLRFVDDESGTSTTTITAGDTVKWVWRSSGHSSTRTDGPKTWDSEIRDVPFTFSQTFPDPGTYRYRCTPHGFLGMVGTVRVVAEGGSGSTTTTTTPGATTTTTAPSSTTSTTATTGTTLPADPAALIALDNALYNQAIEAQRRGDWAEYGRLIEELGRVLSQLQTVQSG